MGNDGGSIARRDDLVKTKGKTEQADKGRQKQAAYQTCALSKKPLSAPIVACPLGRLYNKDALLEYLLAPASAELPLSATPFGADGIATAGHIRSLKDVTQLKLTPNPSVAGKNATRAGETDASVGAARFICPLSQRPMNGATRFVFFEHCGNVVSEAGLKELRGALKKGKKRSPPVQEQQQQQQQQQSQQQQSEVSTLEPCSVCGGPYAPDEPEMGHIINPVDPEEVANLKVRWEAKKAAQKTSKKAKKDVSKKRKATTADPDAADNDHNAKEEKRAKKEAALASAHVLGEGASSGAPRLPASMVAALEAKRDQLSKTAVADLYAKHDPNKKEDWMVRGTFKSRV